ncbi:Alanine--tRNA ligase [Zhongshania aliphaticivorans]|uniref:Alanine--tRNA ligase n=1 Tax=Zhongshania aliphaticivorans TaxID=1470434 RepID=A0A5S9NBQ8_9GAMM|nr:alanine--tRNA ligase [Zhongshania aliphaticivorans]CAA0078286.1 Alanine--tRNA ligase [Zhongshania aliphaticivorans]CAA0086745.1 Alanine--tRNA ligase [Zhongshania aliphaticivorans]
MKSAAIREAFIRYFEGKGHTHVASSSLVPGNDPTLLFTNAGMVQFKDAFLGREKRNYVRAVSSQRCVRAGGKHNDLENVGYTARHHTFFEMLGNFSFGDYFKRDAITFAWEFLTSPEWMAIPAEKLWVTVYADDDEAYQIWHQEVGVPAERMVRIGDNKGEKYASDNFWSMGDTGPCGPCTEIFYDHGEDVFGGPPGSPDEDGDRYIEIWNNVFMQFNRDADGTMTALPAPSVDTGMGLERISAVMQHVHSNYEIDLFQNLITATAKILNVSDLEHTSLRVIADHIRSCAFLVSDGVMPSNEGRGYVLRRIIRRAARHGNKLGADVAFFHKLVAPLALEMGETYPELVTRQAQIEKVLLQEEEQFAKTLEQGMKILEQSLEGLNTQQIPGEIVFRLYDTYGFPVDLTADIAREKDLSLDLDGFETAMEAQRTRARSASNFKVELSDELALEGETVFNGYTELAEDVTVTAILRDGERVQSLKEGDVGVIILASTPFYGESGGQAGDSGYLSAEGVRFEVRDTHKSGGHHLHHGVVLEGVIAEGETLFAEVDNNVRQATALNHSATHLLHAALREILGEHVSQKGSLVDSQRLRFDFSHFEAVSKQELADIEALVNQQIRLNTAVQTEIMDMESAGKRGAMMLFGEKYGESVRVLSMGGDFSIELCGGTHVQRTGDIGLMRITAESGIAAGVRRIEAVTGAAALAAFDQAENEMAQLAGLLKTGRDKVGLKVQQLLAQQKQLEKEVSALKGKLASSAGNDLMSKLEEINGIKVLVTKLDGADAKSLRDAADQLKNKLGSGVVLLATDEGGKVALVAGVTKDLTTRFKAGEMMKLAAEAVGGKGGGRPDMAQGGGSDVDAIPAALQSVRDYCLAK